MTPTDAEREALAALLIDVPWAVYVAGAWRECGSRHHAKQLAEEIRRAGAVCVLHGDAAAEAYVLCYGIVWVD